jgi:hypothetical protein
VIGDGVYDESIAPDTIPSGSGVGGEAAEATWLGATTIRAENTCTGLTTLTPTCTAILRPSIAANCWGSSQAVVAVQNTTSRSYIIFEGFEADANTLCIEVARVVSQLSVTAHHIRFQSTYLHDSTASSGGSGLFHAGSALTDPHHIEVLDSVLKNHSMAGSFGAGGGNHCMYFSASGTIRRNLIDNCSPTDGNGQGIAIHSVLAKVTVDVSANEVSRFGFQGIEVANVDASLFYNNIVRDGSTLGCLFPGFSDTFTCAGIVIQGAGAASNNLIANNTLYQITSRNGGGINFESASSTSNTTIQNNIMYAGDDNRITNTSGASGTFSHNRCDSGCATADNPQFTSAGAGDFTLSGSSPASITAGGTDLSASFTTDKAGNARGSTWSIGAYSGGMFTPSFPVASDFPNTPILDTFNRADSGTLGSNWVAFDSNVFSIASNQAVAPSSGTAFQYWVESQLTSNHEVYATWPTVPTSGTARMIEFAVTNSVTGCPGYEVRATTTTISVIRYDAVCAVSTIISPVDLGTSIADGNGFGVRVSSMTISVYWKWSDGIWYRVGQVTDSNLPLTNVFGGIAGTSPAKITNFGGGPTPDEPPISPPNPPSSVGAGRFGTTFPSMR